MRQCAGEATAGNIAQAAYQAGWADCAEVIRRSVEDKRVVQEALAEDSTFVDPATRKSLRVKLANEVTRG